MVGIFINELVVNTREQGTPVSFKASHFITLHELFLPFLSLSSIPC